MCVQASSAGSGAVGYALAWYGAGASAAAGGYLDKVLLKSGPVFADINRGCEINSSGQNAQYALICQGGQFGCAGWLHEDPPGYSLEYISHYKAAVNSWSGNTGPSCANNVTPTDYSTQWTGMSIVQPVSGNGLPSFNYPKLQCPRGSARPL